MINAVQIHVICCSACYVSYIKTLVLMVLITELSMDGLWSAKTRCTWRESKQLIKMSLNFARNKWQLSLWQAAHWPGYSDDSGTRSIAFHFHTHLSLKIGQGRVFCVSRICHWSVNDDVGLLCIKWRDGNCQGKLPTVTMTRSASLRTAQSTRLAGSAGIRAETARLVNTA